MPKQKKRPIGQNAQSDKIQTPQYEQIGNCQEIHHMLVSDKFNGLRDNLSECNPINVSISSTAMKS